jgi:hypothetical protein
MKKMHIAILTAILTLGIAENLSAFSIGRDGDSYVENEIEWQNVSYSNDDVGFVASIPGSPKSGVSNGDAFTYSQYRGVDYEIHTSLNDRFAPPSSERELIQEIETAFGDKANIVLIPSNQAKVKYIAELSFNNESKIARIYWSHNSIYWAIVEGKDLSLAPQFFDTLKITK